jgi:hypothetical protein
LLGRTAQKIVLNHNEINNNNNNNNNNKHSLRSNTKGYGGKTHWTGSQNSDKLRNSINSTARALILTGSNALK